MAKQSRNDKDEFRHDHGTGMIGAMLVMGLLFFLGTLVVFASTP